MRVVSLASGSKGNAYCVEAQGAVLLIDCGLCCRELERRLRAAGLAPAQIVAAAFTHNHGDHVDGLPVFHRHYPAVELLSNLMTAGAIASQQKMDEADFSPFENGQEFDIGPFRVRAFSIPHDVPDPVGYLVTADGETYFHCTDCGTPIDSVGVKLAEADVATLESNHDPVMLHDSPRHESLKHRIRGPRGHLSNDQAADLVRRFASPRLKRLALAHLSGECNVPHLAENTMRATLAEMNRADIALRILAQDEIVEI
ncbi:MAG: MBL fold metallo-hydrolase [Kiritimatiellia bacterium]